MTVRLHGRDQEVITFRHPILDFRLTDVHGKVVKS